VFLRRVVLGTDGCGCRSKGESAVFVVDPKTSECLYYEAVTGYPTKKYASVPREVLKDHPEVEIRNDLIDCAIDVCSVEVGHLKNIVSLS